MSFKRGTTVNEPVAKDHLASETIFLWPMRWSFKTGSTVLLLLQWLCSAFYFYNSLYLHINKKMFTLTGLWCCVFRSSWPKVSPWLVWRLGSLTLGSLTRRWWNLSTWWESWRRTRWPLWQRSRTISGLTSGNSSTGSWGWVWEGKIWYYNWALIIFNSALSRRVTQLCHLK